MDEQQEGVIFDEADLAPRETPKEETQTAAQTAEGDTPWLDLAERYPDFMKVCGNGEFRAAVKGGERPVEAYLRLENARLAGEMEALRRETALRDAAIGSVQSSADEAPGDPFIEGLSYMR